MNAARVLVGSVVAGLGLVLLLETMDVVDAGEVIGTWWPVVVIAAGLLALATNPRHWMMPAVVVAVGGALLLRSTGVVDSLEIVVPVVLVLVGLLIIFGRPSGGRTVAGEDTVSAFNVFSGSEIASHSSQFRGGTIGALFGGTELDLRDATLAPGATLDVFVAFGAAEIRVPHGWQVTTRGMPIFGGFENVTAKEEVPSDGPVLDINATVLFGGLEVKH